MMFNLLLTVAFAAQAAAFVVPRSSIETRNRLTASINGWTPDATKPCFGLPGFMSGQIYYDPLSLAEGKSLAEIKRFRESEVPVLHNY
jgi:hypothetical protein